MTSNRSDTTAMLSECLIRQILPKFPIWADEVSIGKHDRWSDEHIRVDFMAYRPKDGSRSIRALECGSVHVFEVKSCMADFNSGHGLNRIGDVNWLVITDKLFEQMIDQNAHTSGWNLMVLRDGELWGANPLRPEITTGRRIPVMQAVWAMLMSPRCHVNGEEVGQ